MKKLTLTIEENLFDAARAYAKARGTTVNALVRDYLSSLVTQEARQEEARKELIRLMETSTARLGPGFKWSREELYESRMLPRRKPPAKPRNRSA